MKHRRSPTHSYPHNTIPTPSGHPALALRRPHHPIPTLLSPLRFISNTPLLDGGDDNVDDFQSNAWVSTSYRAPLTGLGITYLRDTSADSNNNQIPSLADDPCGTVSPLADLPYSVIQRCGSDSNDDPCMARIVPSVFDAPTDFMELDFDGGIDSTANDIVGLIPDVNMYDRLRQLDPPRIGVNPLDTISSASPHDLVISYGEPPLLTPDDHRIDNALCVTNSRVEPSPSPQVIQDILSILIQPAPDVASLCSSTSPSIQSQVIVPKSFEFEAPESGYSSLPTPSLRYPAATHSSPVLNAHLGIELDELVSRAERFRMKHPEQDIDRAWLSHFAGKLSNRGELLEDFRCYVIGCDQRNKRRDHILVHVGAHIGQRPFACSICPLRFLRKNECKRHEASHSGFRPYSCDICGQTFVRQDLVKRHVKRTHGMKDENQPGVAKQSTRKKARLR